MLFGVRKNKIFMASLLLLGPATGPVFSPYIIAQVAMKLVLKIYEVAIELPENAHPLLLKMTKTHPQSLCGIPISSGRDFLDIPCNYLLVHNPYHRYQMLPLKRSSRTTASGGAIYSAADSCSAYSGCAGSSSAVGNIRGTGSSSCGSADSSKNSLSKISNSRWSPLRLMV